MSLTRAIALEQRRGTAFVIARWRRLATSVLAVLLVVLLSACQEELYTGLNEREANEMLALLLQHGISASKAADKDSLVSLSVEKTQLPAAVDLLRTHGFPRETYDTVGQVFQKQGLVSSPTEDHIRLVYALSQELNDTLSRIDGVLSARVHVVMPETSPTGQSMGPSSAAVFIRYQSNFDLDQLVPQIKTLVANSIEDLSYDRVSVALFPVDTLVPRSPELGAPDYTQVGFFEVSPGSRQALSITLASLIGLVVVLVIANLATVMMLRRRNGVPQRSSAT